jgi:hypothetical protein
MRLRRSVPRRCARFQAAYPAEKGGVGVSKNLRLSDFGKPS